MRLLSNSGRPQQWRSEVASLEYHLSSENLAAYKNNFRSHLIHYEESIKSLVESSALKVTGGVGRSLQLGTKDLSGCKLAAAIQSRESCRSFSCDPISFEELSNILYFANAVRGDANSTQSTLHRNAPSSGNLGSVELHPMVLNVEGLQAGLYHFDTVGHAVDQVKRGHFCEWLRQQALYQQEYADAAVVIFVTSAVGRLKMKYGERGYRLGLLDVGHVSQNIQLVSTALGLKVCPTAGFVDSVVNRFIGLDGLDVCTMLAVVVGRGG